MPSLDASIEAQAQQINYAHIRIRAQCYAASLDMGAGLREILGLPPYQ